MRSLNINIPVAENNVPHQEDIDSWPHIKSLRVSTLQVEVGFLIRANIPKAMEMMQVNHLQHLHCLLFQRRWGHLPMERVLGIQWWAESDQFRLMSHLNDRTHAGRGMFSLASYTFALLGFLVKLIFATKESSRIHVDRSGSQSRHNCRNLMAVSSW